MASPVPVSLTFSMYVCLYDLFEILLVCGEYIVITQYEVIK